MEHKCDKEANIAVLEVTTKSIDKKVDKILSSLDGDNGLTAKTKANETSLSRLWWFVGVLATVILSTAGYIVKLKL